MIKPIQATSDGDAYESNSSEGIWTAGINLPIKPESVFSRFMDKTWNSRIECHGESKEDAEELRDAVLTAVSNPEQLQDVTLAERLAAMASEMDGMGESDVGDLLREAAAALSVLGWLPIESAPRDGTRIILGRPDIDGDGGVSASGYWEDALEDGVDYMGHDGGFTDSDYQVFTPGRSFGNPDYRYVGSQPTHWQPLPATPPSEG